MSSNVSRWLTAAKMPAKAADNAALQGAALVAAVRPGLPAAVLATELQRTITKISRIEGGHDFLGQLAHDERLPGWARLRVALATDDAALVRSLERFTVPMVKLVSTAYGNDAAGVRLLPAVRRAQLAVAGCLMSSVRLNAAELEEVLPTLSRSGSLQTPEAIENLVRVLDIAPRNFKTVWMVLANALDYSAGGQTSPEAARLHTRVAFVALASKLNAFAKVKGVTAFPVVEYRRLFTDSSVTSVPMKIGSDIDDEVVVKFLSSTDRVVRRLGVALVEGPGRSPKGAVLEALAVVPEAGVKLVDGYGWNGNVNLLADRVEALGVLDRVGRQMLRKNAATHLMAKNNAAAVERLAKLLGEDSWVLGYVLVKAIAETHGYGQRFSLPPACVRAEIASAVWEDPTPRIRELVSVMGSSPDSEDLDKARTVLADDYIRSEDRFMPSQLMHGSFGYLMEKIVFFVCFGDRSSHKSAGFESEEDRDEHWLSWIRNLPASQMTWLLEDVSERLGRDAKTPALPRVLRAYLTEVLEIAETPAAQEALSASLRTGHIHTVLPSSMTLGEFARELCRADRALGLNNDGK